jgi:hypothetical protein
MRLIHAPLLFKIIPYDAMTVYPFVFHKDVTPSPVTINHENIHLQQIAKVGVLKFYFLYLYHYLRNLIKYKNHDLAYLNIPYEVEAYDNQENFEYKVKV